MNSDAREAVDANSDEWSVPSHINGEVLALEHGAKIVMVVRRSTRNILLMILSAIVKRIRVKRLIYDDVVLKQSLEVFLAILAEQESIDTRPKLLERKVAGREECSAVVWILRCVHLLKQARLAETEFKCAELTGEEVDDGSDVGRGNQDAIYAVHDAVCAEDVDGDELAVEVYGGALEGDAHGEALLVAEELVGGLVEGGDGVGVQDAAGGVEVVADMVEEDAFEDFLGRFLAVLGNLGEGFVGGGEDGVVCLCAVEDLDEVVEFVDELCKLCCVLALVDELMSMLVWAHVVCSQLNIPRILFDWACHHGRDDEACRGVAVHDEVGDAGDPAFPRSQSHYRRKTSPEATRLRHSQPDGPWCRCSSPHP